VTAGRAAPASPGASLRLAHPATIFYDASHPVPNGFRQEATAAIPSFARDGDPLSAFDLRDTVVIISWYGSALKTLMSESKVPRIFIPSG
jgi:hypothetical protein